MSRYGRLLKTFLVRWLVVAPVTILLWLALSNSTVKATPSFELFHSKKAAAREVIIKFRSASQPIQSVERNQDVDSVNPLNGGNLFLLHSRSKSVTALVSELSARSDVLYAEPNYILSAAQLPNDPSFGSQWDLSNTGQTINGKTGVTGADIHSPAAWDISTGSNTNVTAVVDTGINYNHPDLAANVWSASSAFSVKIGNRTITCAAGTHGFNAINNTCNPMDDNNHGSHVSGTIGAVGNNGVGVTGVNWTTKIMATKFLNSSGSGTTANAINAIEFVIQAKAAFASSGGANVRVVSNSWGGSGFSQALLDEINKANSSDMLFVAAAGNSSANNDSSSFYPANYNAPNIISVAATDNSDLLASFSNYGLNRVHLGAPGVDILSTLINGYGYGSGTSMATPHVSGAAALVLSKCSLNTSALKLDILNNVDSLASLAGKTVTGGRLDVAKALAACSVPAVPDFALSASAPTATVTQGNGTSVTVNIAPVGGFSGPVSLDISGLPSGATASFNPNPAIGTSSLLTINADTSTVVGSYPLTINGVNGSLSHSTNVTLVVQAPPPPVVGDFSVSISPASAGVSFFGGTASYTVNISKSGGFSDPISFSISGLPAGVTTSFSPNPAPGGSVTLRVTASSSLSAGSYPFTVTASGGIPLLSHTTNATFVKRVFF